MYRDSYNLHIMISIHALREEGDGFIRAVQDAPVEFLSTPSARRATRRAGSVRGMAVFLSTPSARRATQNAWYSIAIPHNFYPRPPRGGRPQCYGQHDTSK